ncbi:MAG: 4Fe-4S binding protein, partial [Blautia sp.]
CAPCPSGIEIARVNKLYDLAVMQPEVPSAVREHYRSLKANGDDCVGCKSCEERCPFGVAVASRMEKAASLFCDNH